MRPVSKSRTQSVVGMAGPRHVSHRSHDCKVDFTLIRTSSDNLMTEEQGTRNICICWRKAEVLSTDALNSMLADIIKYCLTHRLDSYKIHLDRLKGESFLFSRKGSGVQLIKRVSRRTNYNDIAVSQIIALVWSCLSAVHHFHIRVSLEGTYRMWFRRRQYQDSMLAYERVLLMLLPQLFTTVMKSLITFFDESKVWQLESYVARCLKVLLAICKDGEGIIGHLLDVVEIADDVDNARCVLRVIHNLLMEIKWKEMEESFLERLLETYRRSVMNEECECLESALECCLRAAFKNMKRSDLVKVLRKMIDWAFVLQTVSIGFRFGDLMEFVAGLNNDLPYEDFIDDDMFNCLFELIAVNDTYISLLATRVLFFMLDRCKNAELLQPKVYFQDVDSHLKLNTYDMTDKDFLQDSHNLWHNNALSSLMQHCKSKANLEALFGVFAVMVVEVPCGYTAAAAVSFAMSAQEYALSMPDMKQEVSYRIHACIISTISLVCHVHDAKVFYEYVNSILSKRAQLAPQLNPPLFETYDSHPFLLAKPVLYFEDWEARFGLYKCFMRSFIDEKCTEKSLKKSKRKVDSILKQFVLLFVSK